ncbi:hypothetical protein [Streptomyces sp. NPDC055607]
MKRISGGRIAAVVSTAALVTLALPVESGAMPPPSAERVVVSIGDGSISGVGGRWQGNTNLIFHNQNGTDRGEGAYGSTNGGCYRSDVSEINSALITEHTSINLACDGATAWNVFRPAKGGKPFKGEATQAEQLAQIASTKNVDMIVMSLGNFEAPGFLRRCLNSYMGTPSMDCAVWEQGRIQQQIVGWMKSTDKAVKDVREVMAEAGYRTSDYELVIQSYAAPLPKAADMRYKPRSERSYRQCPFSDNDLNWLHNWFYPTMVTQFKRLAKDNQADFLDVSEAFRGHETCSNNARSVDFGGDNGSHSEWTRNARTMRISPGDDGVLEEALQPNAWGQLALGQCLRDVYYEMWWNSDTSWKCVPSGANLMPREMSLTHSP